MMERVKEKEASQLVSDAVALGMMAPIIGGGIAIGIGLPALAAKYAIYGDVPNLAQALGSVNGQTQLIVLAAVGFAYWIVFNYLFGENVQETIDQAQEAQETVEE